MEWNGMEWNGMEWNGTRNNGMEWNGTESNGIGMGGWNGIEGNGRREGLDGRVVNGMEVDDGVDGGWNRWMAEWNGMVWFVDGWR